MPPTTKAELLEDLKKQGLRPLGSQLEGLATDVLRLLSQADAEARRLPDDQQKPWVLALAPKGIGMIREYQNRLIRAMVERDPKALHSTAGLFGSLSRFFGDEGYEWFSRRDDLDKLLTQLYNVADAIFVSINTFEPASMESARKALS